ncbi:unnamed protein product [Oreochromis niloticus]|nr:unnamed protein product [Mustela putorius furo]
MTEFNSVNRGKSVEIVSLLQPDKMLEEMGTLDCRHLKLPLLTLENLGKVITPYVKDVSQDQWASLADGDPGSKVVILLSSMCHAVIEEISALVLEVVEPQVLAKGHNHASGDKVSLQDGCSCCRVTENNIQASFRNTLHHCFGEALSMAQGKSYNADILVKLFSAEITKKVNTSLARITGPAPTPKTHDSVTGMSIIQMVYNVTEIFECILNISRKITDRASDSMTCSDSNCKQICCLDVEEEEDAEIPQISDCSLENSLCMDNLSPPPTPELPKYSETFVPSALILAYQENSSPSLESPDCPVNMTFLTVLLAKLVDHIASKTRTSILNVDLVALLGGVTMRAEKELDSIPPPSVENLHIPIYKKLCKVFGSKYLLQAAMESGDEAFEIAVSEVLVSQLQKSLVRSKNSGTIWRVVKDGKLSPVREIPTPESPTEESNEPKIPLLSNTSPASTLKKSTGWFSRLFDTLNRALDSDIHRLDYTVTNPPVWTNPVL